MDRIIASLINQVIKFLNEDYQVILESDLQGLLFYSLIDSEDVVSNDVHLNTRIIQSKGDRDKIDIAVGKITSVRGKRPSINPYYLFELKAIPVTGFNASQQSIRFGEVKSDIIKIANYSLEIPRFIIIFDGIGYFGNKMEELNAHRNSYDDGIEIVRIKRNNTGNWHFETT